MSIAGWDDFVERLRSLPDRMLAKLPVEQSCNPQIQQEVGRLAVQALAAGALDVLASDRNHPTFVVQIGQVLNIGQPNAHTTYRVARISSDGVNRLRGRSDTLRMPSPSPKTPRTTLIRERRAVCQQRPLW